MRIHLLAVAAAFAVAAAVTIDTPVTSQCRPALLNWHNGTAPFYLSIHTGENPNNKIYDFTLTPPNITSLTWTVNYTGGSYLGLTVTDATGAIGQSGAFTVEPSPDRSCLAANATVVGIAPSSTGATTPTSTSPPLPATTPVGGIKSSSGTPTSTSGSQSPSPSSASSADKIITNSAVVGVIAAAVFALLA